MEGIQKVIIRIDIYGLSLVPNHKRRNGLSYHLGYEKINVYLSD